MIEHVSFSNSIFCALTGSSLCAFSALSLAHPGSIVLPILESLATTPQLPA
jgi:hypothetical protein